MPWWGWLALWFVIVVGTVAGAAYLAVHLWGKAMALVDELERFETVIERLEAVVDPPPSAWVHPLTATDADVRRWRGGIADRRTARADRRLARHEAAHRRWTRWWG
ncbi:MAG: hypothetical protein FWD11_10915 [Micrococcales bacterium]|nr:hypothetical protein [Micrococcales bacterium]